MRGLVLGSLAVLGATIAPAHATLVHDYELNGTLDDALGGPSLTPHGGALSLTGYTFGVNQGLDVSGLSVDGAGPYAIDIGFSFDETGGYRRILDFKNLTSDTGLYNFNSYANFYNEATGASPVFTAGQQADLVLTRSASGLVSTYVNNVLQFSFDDSVNQLAVFTVLNFFIDDNVVPGEASSGFVDYIRIGNSDSDFHPSAVPLPATLPLFASGIAALGYFARRSRADRRRAASV